MNLTQLRVLVVTGEASYHANYDHCTVKYLDQAGVYVDHLQLGEQGIHGNGHMMMLEKNGIEIARAIHQWLRTNQLAS